MGAFDNIKIGDRIRLLRMDNDPSPIPAGTTGTVNWIGEMDQLGVKWDDGRTLGLVPEDKFEVIAP